MMGRLRIALALPLVLVAAACSPQESDARVGTPRAARGADCDLKIVSGSSPDTMNKYEQVGVVRLSNVPAGTDPLDKSVRSIVRPRACALGGEAISVLASGDASRGFATHAYASYIVWAKKQAASTGQKF